MPGADMKGKVVEPLAAVHLSQHFETERSRQIKVYVHSVLPPYWYLKGWTPQKIEDGAKNLKTTDRKVKNEETS